LRWNLHNVKGGREGEEEEEEEEELRWCGGSPSKEAISFLYLNAQSIVKKIDELACIADEEKPDFILVTESWCNSSISDAFL